MKFQTRIEAEGFLSNNEIFDGEVVYNIVTEKFEIRFLSTEAEGKLEERTKDLFADFMVEYEEEFFLEAA